MWYDKVRDADPELYEYIKSELSRQQDGLEMIPSENFTSIAVMQASGSILTNKYSEGYPGRRYYGGNEFIDKIETLASERAKKLFKVPYANVQPYSGSPANLAVYFAICKPGDTIMGLDLTHGGHLTHGWKTSVTGQAFRSIPYHVKKDGSIDLEEAGKLAREHKPKIIWVGYTAYPREFPFEEFSKIADESGAYLVADISHIAGLVAGGMHKSPVDYVHVVTTTTHKTLRGPRGAMIMVTDKGMEKDPDLGKKIDKTIIPGMQGGPHNHQTAAVAVALLEASKPEFREYAGQVVRNAKALADSLMKNGLTTVTNGTDTHLILIDLTPFGKGLGIFAEEALGAAGITVNKNTIPNEQSSAFYPSGIRLGTPAITTRGMKEPEMEIIGGLFAEAINQVREEHLPENKEELPAYLEKFRRGLKENQKLKEVRARVVEMTRRFPLYREIELSR
jgi:glycine hydroxymethyltransferase